MTILIVDAIPQDPRSQGENIDLACTVYYNSLLELNPLVVAVDLYVNGAFVGAMGPYQQECLFGTSVRFDFNYIMPESAINLEFRSFYQDPLNGNWVRDASATQSIQVAAPTNWTFLGVIAGLDVGVTVASTWKVLDATANLVVTVGVASNWKEVTTIPVSLIVLEGGELIQEKNNLLIYALVGGGILVAAVAVASNSATRGAAYSIGKSAYARGKSFVESRTKET